MHVIFKDLPAVVVLRMTPGWTVIAQPEGILLADTLTAVRELLTDEERDVVRAAYDVPPLAVDPSKRVWFDKVPDRICQCVVPEALLPPPGFRGSCRTHEGADSRVEAGALEAS